MKKSPTGLRILKICKHCSSEFSVIPARKDNAKFCSILCHNRNIGENREPHTEDYKRKIGIANSGLKIDKKCRYCGIGFIVNTANLQRKYCSQICAWTDNRGENNTRWKGGKENKLMHTQKRRALKLNADGSDDISNIQPLCRSCNSIKHTKTFDYRLLVNETLCH